MVEAGNVGDGVDSKCLPMAEVEDVAGVVDADWTRGFEEGMGLVDEIVVAECDGAGLVVDVESGWEGCLLAAAVAFCCQVSNDSQVR